MEGAHEVGRARVPEPLGDVVQRDFLGLEQEKGPLAALALEQAREGCAQGRQLAFERARRDGKLRRHLIERAERLLVRARDGAARPLDQVSFVPERIEGSLALLAREPQRGAVGVDEGKSR